MIFRFGIGKKSDILIEYIYRIFIGITKYRIEGYGL